MAGSPVSWSPAARKHCQWAAQSNPIVAKATFSDHTLFTRQQTMGKHRRPKFEDAIAQLEQIIENLESGETGLEDSLAEYEKGMDLIKQCRTILGTVQKKIKKLTASTDGKLVKKDTNV